MSAYVIVDVSIKDHDQYEEYKKMTPGSLALFEGRFVARGGETEILEGDWNPGRMVILEFPTVDKAREWWNSDVYAPAKALRQRIADTNMILVEGA